MNFTPMTELLQTALETVLPGAVYPILYTGTGAVKYIVWNYSVIPAVFADSAPHAARYLVQIHLYWPHRENPTDTLRQIDWAVFNAGFTWPSMTDASDSEGQHWVLECQYADGGGFYNGATAGGT